MGYQPELLINGVFATYLILIKPVLFVLLELEATEDESIWDNHPTKMNLLQYQSEKLCKHILLEESTTAKWLRVS